MILLETQKEMENMVEDRKLFIDEELISLQLTQIKDDNGIKRELNILITILITTSIKDITSEITLIEKDDITNTVVNEFKCSNKIRYMIIMKIMYWLVKLYRKKDDMVNNSTSKTKDSTSKTKTISKTKNKDNTTLDKINNKKNLINKINIRLSKAKTKVTNNIKSVYKAKCKLQDEIYLNDTCLRLDELNRIDTIFDDTLNVVWYEIYGKNRKSSKIINIGKHKNIGKYASKLEDIIINNIKLMCAMNMKITRTLCDDG